MNTEKNIHGAVNDSYSFSDGNDSSIGEIIKQSNNLSIQQIDQVAAYQREHGVKFGEAAVALGFAKKEDVLWALAQQFHYPYSDGKKTINNELVAATQPFSEMAELFRDVRSHLLMNTFAGGNEAGKAIAITSVNSGDGKSFFSANLGVTFSQLGGRTLLLDADLRSPRLHEIFGVESSSGLSGILSGRSETNVIRPVDNLPSLYLLPVGTIPPNPLELVQRPAFDLLIAELRKKFDYIIVDTPALERGTDAKIIAAKCGAAMAIGRRGVTNLNALNSLVSTMKKTRSNFSGVVMNNI